MKLTSDEFMALPQKRITLMGMSGSGKTYITSFLDKLGWTSYSCDYQIGSKYLKDDLAGLEAFSAEDISLLSHFIGKLGNEEKGGYALDLFKERQMAYYNAETAAVGEAIDICMGSTGNFVHDSTGSLCEIMDENLLARVGEHTLFVYLTVDDEGEKAVLKRAQDYPKPLFFPPAKLDQWIDEFLHVRKINAIDEIEPDDFARWVFPNLFESRKPKYERLAELYGVTIPAKAFLNFKTEQDFLDIIAKHLP